MVEGEKEMWGDLVTLNLRDTYDRLTLQMLLSFEWVNRYRTNRIENQCLVTEKN